MYIDNIGVIMTYGNALFAVEVVGKKSDKKLLAGWP